jgi:hypothetical protein
MFNGESLREDSNYYYGDQFYKIHKQESSLDSTSIKGA